MASLISERIAEIESRLEKAAQKSGRRRDDVTLLAVTKTWPATTVREAYAAGLKFFGENYAQEFTEKKSQLNDLPLKWHFIGHLQTNKVKFVVGECDLVHSVDRIKVAREISTRAQQKGLVQKVLIEVNIGDEESKSGLRIAELPALIDAIQELPGIQVCGLMTMPPLTWSEVELRRAFQKIRDERDRLVSRLSSPHNLLELSMGTSQDYEWAVESGSTIVRLGTVIFGKRS